jgi:hypothetical protein
MHMIFQGRSTRVIPGIAAVIDDIVVGFEDAVMLGSTAGTTGGS